MFVCRIGQPFITLVTVWGWLTVFGDHHHLGIHATRVSHDNSTRSTLDRDEFANNLSHDGRQKRRRRLAGEGKILPMTAAFWNERVPDALRGQAPQAGRSTLLFVHIPKTAGSSMERVLERLCDTRPPLCMRRFMSSDPQRDKDGGYGCDCLVVFAEDMLCLFLPRSR